MLTLKRAGLALLAVAIVAAGFFAFRALLADDEPEPPPVPATAMIDGPDADRKPDDTLRLGPAAQRVLERAEGGGYPDLEGNLRGDDPFKAGVIDGTARAQTWPGCKTNFVGSFSSRGGVVPNAFAPHFTAGWNIVGWADLDGLTAFSDTHEVSWHFGIDREGHCVYNVALKDKAWTIGNLNRQTINVEMVGRGSEIDYGGPAGRRTLARIWARVHMLYPNIPLAVGATNGRCSVTRPGWITHWMGGPCSGGHSDIRPYSLGGLVAEIKRLTTPRSQLPGPSPKPAWFWVAMAEWLGGQRDGLFGPSPKPVWFWGAVAKWQAQH